MRALGLVHDFTFELKKDQADQLAAVGKGRISVNIGMAEAVAPDRLVATWTRFIYRAVHKPVQDRYVFMAAPGADADTEHSSGFLKLGDSKLFGLHSVDVPAAVQKLLGANSAQPTPAGTAAAPMKLPPLRTVGLSIYREEGGKRAGDRMKQSAALDRQATHNAPGAEIELGFDDLVRGYAIDVRYENPKQASATNAEWLSLCSRQGRYRVAGKDYLQPAPEEGCVIQGATIASDKALCVHETLFTWDGWSLTAPRPERCLDAADDAKCGDDSGLLLETRFEPVCNTLPKLRFGWSYALRGRAVDLAGNGLELNTGRLGAQDFFEDAKDAAMSKVVHVRFEPPNAPTVHTIGDDTNGRAIDLLEIRNEVERDFYVAPPAISNQMAIDHGMFDVCSAKDVHDRFEDLRKRAREPNWGKLVRDSRFPFVPDPLVASVLISGLPKTNSQKPTQMLMFGTAGSPRSITLTVRKTPHNGPSYYEKSNQDLVLYLQRGDDLKLTLRPCLRDANDVFAALGMWNWSAPVAADQKKVRDLAVAGISDTLCPERTIRVVHAVSKPDRDATLLTPAATRGVQEVAAKLTGKIRVDTWTTGAVQLSASWVDALDTGDEQPRQQAAQGSLGQQTINRGADSGVAADDYVDLDVPFSLGDTRYRKLEIIPTALTRFTTAFPNGELRPGPKATLDMLASARPPAPAIGWIVPTYGWTRPDPGGNQEVHTRSGYGVRVYLQRPWFESGIGEHLAVVLPLANEPPADALRKTHVSSWGIDPAWYQTPQAGEATPPVLLGVRNFPGRHKLKDDEIYQQVVGNDLQRFHVAAFELRMPTDSGPGNYDAARKQWFCDLTLQLDAGTRQPALYAPFLRLALARLQPNAQTKAEDLRLSKIVTADIVQLPSDRIVTITRGSAMTVTVQGPYLRNTAETHAMFLSEETHLGGADDAGWQEVARHELKYGTIGDSDVWTSGPIQVKSGSKRLVLQEFELYGDRSGKGYAYKLSFLDVIGV
ncbi:MAG: hypothetical protein QM723_18455 [Myxococcaceae bacterium]